MLYKVKHKTHYKYASPVSVCFNQGHLIPSNNDFQRCINYRVDITPTPRRLRERVDYFGNRVFSFDIHRNHSSLVVVVESNVEVFDRPASAAVNETAENNDPVAATTPAPLAWEACLQQLQESDREVDLVSLEYALPSPFVPLSDRAKSYAESIFKPGADLLTCLAQLNDRIFHDFKYEPGSTLINTSVDEVLEKKKGVCQDFALVALACLRSLGIPCRYVSGYLETVAPEGKEKLLGADASHAWLSVYSPLHGWLDYDPTNGKIPDGRYIRLAYGRDYSDVTPLSGVIVGGAKNILKVEVDVIPQK